MTSTNVDNIEIEFQGEIMYEVVGLYPAMNYFSVVANTGVVKVIGNIKADPLRLMSYTVSL